VSDGGKWDGALPAPPPVKPGEFAFLHLGQMSELFRFGEVYIGVDLFFSELPGRLVPPPCAPEALPPLAAFIASHDHADHLDRAMLPRLLASSPAAPLVLPRALPVDGLPPTRLVRLNAGESAIAAGVKITAIAAAHEFLDRDPASGCYPHLAYVFEGNGVTVGHLGDCCIYEGLVSTLRNWRFDVLFLPINGRDAWRYTHDFIGNMTYQEAVDLAGTLGTRVAVPGHFDMFASNAADPKDFTEYLAAKYPDTSAVVPAPGEWKWIPGA